MQSPRTSPKFSKCKTPSWVLLFGAYCLILGFRLPFIVWPPSELLYNVDELEVTLSAVDRFLGVPTTGLHWPGTFLHFLFLPLFVLDYLIRFGVRADMSSNLIQWSSYISEVYRHPAHAVALMRMVSVSITSTFPLVIYLLLRRGFSVSRTMAVLAAAAVVAGPLMSQHAVMATGDGSSISLAFASLALVVLAPARPWREWVAGLLMAAAVCSKLTALTLIAAPMIYLMLEGRDSPLSVRIRGVLRLTAGFIAGVLVWFPYLWTDPSRAIKAIVGNINKMGSGADIGAFLIYWNEAAGVVIISLAVIAWLLLPIGVRDRRVRPLLVACAATFLLVTVPLYFRATSTFPRYYLPLVPLAILLFAANSSGVERTSKRRLWSNTAALSLVAACAFGIFETFRAEWSLRAGSPLFRALKEVETTASRPATLFVPEQARLAGFAIPSETYNRIHNRIVEEYGAKRGLQKFLTAHGIPPQAAAIFGAAFDEKDTSAVARANAMLYPYAAEPNNTRVILWCDNESNGEISMERTAICEYDRNHARLAFLSSPGALILVREPDPSLGELFSNGGDRWLWYRNPLKK